MSTCRHCGSRTGQHSFSMNSDGSYSGPSKDLTFGEFQTIRVNVLKELLAGIRIVNGSC
jgi:hypothetical protein